MKNVFLFMSPVLDRAVSFQIDYVLDTQVDTIILMSENHYSTDSDYFFTGKNINIYATLQECVEHCDIIITLNDLLSRLSFVVNKEIIVLELDECANKELTIPNLEYTNKPVISILSLGDYNDQYNTEIIVHKILADAGAKTIQLFSYQTKKILESFYRVNRINSALSQFNDEIYDIIVLTIDQISSYQHLLRIMCDISPDIIFLCVNHSYSQINEIEKCLYGCGQIDAVIKSPYISFEIVKGKTYPVFCGNHKTFSCYDSFENNLYDNLKKIIFNRLYLPKSAVLI